MANTVYKLGLVIALILIFQIFANSQISGVIQNEAGELLPFATVYIKGTTRGTFSNDEGEYELDLKAGENTIIYNYVGYAPIEFKVSYKGGKLKKNVVLNSDDVVLTAVVIRSDAEDPAYAIIRNAIKVKDHFNNKPVNFKVNKYQKLKLELNNVPDKIFGFNIKQTEEDEKLIEEFTYTSNNVLMVTETISEYYRDDKGHSKEIIVSSITSGDKNGNSRILPFFSKMNFYDNSIEFGKNLVSPVSDNAMLFYKFKLIGTFPDVNGNLINKIAVIPKNEYGPVFQGNIFIVEDSWNIYAIDVMMSSKNTNYESIDTVRIKQDYQQIGEGNEKVWTLNSQFSTITVKVLGFKFTGYFTMNNTNYILNQEFGDDFFNHVSIKIDENANIRDSIYWEKLRPVPLSIKEEKGYFRMDSIEQVTSSKQYLDSIDREDNKFKPLDLVQGYTFSNTYAKCSFNISSLLTGSEFNTVQGYRLAERLTFRKEHEDQSYWVLGTRFEYGFADNKFLPTMNYENLINNKHHLLFSAGIGRKYLQLREASVLDDFIDEISSLFLGRNFRKFYQNDFINGSVQRHFIPGINVELSFNYSKRSILKNNTDFKFCTKNEYSPNIYEDMGDIKYNEIFRTTINFKVKPGVKYIEFPNRLIASGSKYPEFSLQYQKAISIKNNFVSYDFIKFGIDGNFSSSLFGNNRFSLEAGKFLSDSKVDEIDDIFFGGSEIISMSPERYYNSFHLLSYNNRSEFNDYIRFNTVQNLKGVILNKIPWLKKLKLEEELSFNSLLQTEMQLYYEVGVGISGLFKAFNLRYSRAFESTRFIDSGLRVTSQLRL